MLKALGSSLYRFSGHVMIVPFSKDKWKRMESDNCWWCNNEVEQGQEDLFKERFRWKKGTWDLWNEVYKVLETA